MDTSHTAFFLRMPENGHVLALDPCSTGNEGEGRRLAEYLFPALCAYSHPALAIALSRLSLAFSRQGYLLHNNDDMTSVCWVARTCLPCTHFMERSSTTANTGSLREAVARTRFLKVQGPPVRNAKLHKLRIMACAIDVNLISFVTWLARWP